MACVRGSVVNRLVALLIALALGGCQGETPEVDVESDIAAVQSVIDGMTAAYEARDWNAFTGYFTEEGVWMPPDLPALQGEEAWWEFASTWWDDTEILEIGGDIDEIVVSGDWAMERHTEYITMSITGIPEPVTMHFKGMRILQRGADGGWKIARYVWNGNAATD